MLIIPNTSGIIKKIDILKINTDLNTKTTEIESKIPDITYLATKAALNIKAIEIRNKITDISNFEELNRLTKISFDARLKEAEKILASKTKVNNALGLIR